MQSFDHTPCIIHINTSIPKARIFRFENYWMEHEHFLQMVQHGWSVPVSTDDPAKLIMARFKNLRRVLKAWHAHISSLALLIENIKILIHFLEVIEEFRDPSFQSGILSPF